MLFFSSSSSKKQLIIERNHFFHLSFHSVDCIDITSAYERDSLHAIKEELSVSFKTKLFDEIEILRVSTNNNLIEILCLAMRNNVRRLATLEFALPLGIYVSKKSVRFHESTHRFNADQTVAAAADTSTFLLPIR